MLSITVTKETIEKRPSAFENVEGCGACVEFSGMIRGTEDGESIQGLEYEAYVEMAEKVMLEKLKYLQEKYGFLAAEVVHRFGKIAVGEMAIVVRVWSAHRKEAYAANMEFMDELKKDVPIWKVASF